MIRDHAGNVAKVVCLVLAAAIDPSGGAIAAIRTAIIAITKAVSPRAESGVQSGEDASGVATSAYGSIEDRATLTFAAADGSTEVFEIPGPIASSFVSGSDQVAYPGSTPMASVIDYIVGNGVSKFGQALTFVKGTRTKKATMKV